jgi:2-dehydropantoate 2-reductase
MTATNQIPRLKVAVVGAGALGLYYGAMLQRAGQPVHFLLRRDLQAITASGLQVRSINGDFYLDQVAGYASSQEIGPVDLVLVGLKTFANRVLVDLVKPLMGPTTAILTLQNGLGNEELLVAAFGPKTVLGGIAFLCANRGEPGTVLHLGEGRIRLGEAAGGLSARADELAGLFRQAGVPCEAVADLQRARWEKLVWNIPFNGLCALTGKDVTALLNHAPSAELVEKIMGEVVVAANRQPLSEPLDGARFVPKMLNMTRQMDHYRPSMLLDRLEGRQLELEAIYAIPLLRARAAGVATPLIEMLYTLLDLGETVPT